MTKKKIIYKVPPTAHAKAKAYMREVLAALNDSGAIEKVDVGVLDLLASSYSVFCHAEDRLASDGVVINNRFGDLVPHPSVKIREQAFTQCLRAMKELGLTIRSRAQLPAVQGSDYDPMGDFISG